MKRLTFDVIADLKKMQQRLRHLGKIQNCVLDGGYNECDSIYDMQQYIYKITYISTQKKARLTQS